MPLFRGMAEMCLGMYACKLSRLMQKSGHIGVFSALTPVSFITGILIATFFGRSHMDFLVLALFFFGVAAGFLPGKQIPKEPSRPESILFSWSDIALEMYLLHELFRMYIFPACFSREVSIGQKLFYMLLYMAAVTAAATFLKKCKRAVIKFAITRQ